MMTVEELNALGYEFKIKGNWYEVVHTPPLEVSGTKLAGDDLIDSFQYMLDNALLFGTSTGRFTSAAPKIMNVPRQTAKVAALAAGYSGKSFKAIHDEITWDNWTPRVILRGKIERDFDFRNKRGAPKHMNNKQVMELCIKAAIVDHTKRRLLA